MDCPEYDELPSDVRFRKWLESLDPVIVERDRLAGASHLEVVKIRRAIRRKMPGLDQANPFDDMPV
jgi:hypothetical protein